MTRGGAGNQSADDEGFKLAELFFAEIFKNFAAGTAAAAVHIKLFFDFCIGINEFQIVLPGKELAQSAFSAMFDSDENDGTHDYMTESGRTIWVPTPLEVKISSSRECFCLPSIMWTLLMPESSAETQLAILGSIPPERMPS